MKFFTVFALLALTSTAGAESIAHTATGSDATCAKSLVIYQNGIALSAFPSSSQLSRTVSIGSASMVAGTPCWSATSDVPWLTTVASGHNLIVTADATGIQTDSEQSATVTVASKTTPGQTATIRVALWVGSSDPGPVAFAQTTASIAANPVDPLAYASIGSSAIGVYNVYTGQLLDTFTPVAPTVGALAVSSDGRTLFAADTTNYRIVAMQAITGKVLANYKLAGPIFSDFSFAFARPYGIPTLFAPGQKAIDVATGRTVSEPITISSGFYDPLIAATPDGKRLAIVERGLSPGSIYIYSVSSAGGGQLAITEVKSGETAGSNCEAMAINRDGTRVYPACGAPYEFDVYDGTTLQQVQTLPAVPYPDNAVIDSNGDFVGGVNGLYQADDVFVFDKQGYSLGDVPTVNQTQGQGANLMATSGDSTRVISGTGYTLMFRSLP